ncbi:hypothetical protein B2G52_03810 [Neisseria lactamica]|uniref:Uncharacterized protein n=1 Tax=Neisseria lactamica TaxID=486 RepID=A0AAU8VDM3_NEILA|nr:hypothetical protein B2G52_03810 [Neisseria lactamica]
MPEAANRQIAGRRRAARQTLRPVCRTNTPNLLIRPLFYATIKNQNQIFKTILKRLFRTKGRRASGKKGFCI